MMTTASATALLLAAFLVSATVPAAPASAAASANTPYSDLSKQLFVKYEQLAWHYAYQESEKQNLESFEKWWCQDSTDDSCALINNPDFIFMMRYFEQHRDTVIWNLTQQAPQVPILPKHIKYLVSKDYADAANVDETFTTPWKSFVTWNQLAFHFDFAKTEAQNFDAFQKWFCEGSSSSPGDAACNFTAGQLASMMWFYEQHRDGILSTKVIKQLAHPVDKPEIEGWISVDYLCAIENNASACDTMMAAAKDDVQ